MMQRIIFLASVLLFLQIGLVVKTNMDSRTLEAAAPNTLFLSFTPGAVTGVEITGPDNTHLVLEKTDSGWILPKTFSAPADNAAVEKLLEKLSGIKQGLAVATSADSSERLKTGAENFERHMVLKEGGSTVADFYLGTSSGFRYSHARKAGDEEVVTLPISSFEAEVEADKWLDRNVAAIDKNALEQIELADITLTRKDNEWHVEELSPDETNREEVAKLLDRVTGITVQTVLAPEEAVPLVEKSPQTQFTVTKTNGTTVKYSIAGQEELFVLKMSDSSLYYTLSKWQADNLAVIALSELKTAESEPGMHKKEP